MTIFITDRDSFYLTCRSGALALGFDYFAGSGARWGRCGFCGAARTLFRRDGTNDEAMLAVGVEGNFGAGCGGFHQGEDSGIIERAGRGQADMADEIAITLQYFFGGRAGLCLAGKIN